MEAMLIGETLMKKPSTAGVINGYWVPRGGDRGTFAIQILTGGGSDWTMKIQGKKSEEPDSSATDLGSATLTSGVVKLEITGCKELVRYVVTHANNANAGRIHQRVLEPQWARE